MQKQMCQHCQHTGLSEESCVSRVPIFNHLDASQKEEVHRMIHSVTYKKGESIYQANDSSQGLIIVNEGRIRIDRISEKGAMHLIRILNPGDFTGELALFKETPNEDYATAMVDSRVCKISRIDLQNLMRQYPNIAMKILSTFASRLEEVEKNNTRLVSESVDCRIILFLLDAMDHNHVMLSMSKKDLASYLGTTPETLSRKLFELEDAQLIKQHSNRHIELLDIEALSKL
jgi:CRP/FNR family transcriptional regulator, anaerobic regulatory protein